MADFVRCKKGHFYDASQGSCPQCAIEEAGADAADYGSTQPIGVADYQPYPGTEALGIGGEAGVESYDKTQPISPDGTVGFSPVTGWLVCIEGPDRGMDYRIRNGYNYIGRGEHMDICIRNDQHISMENQAVVGYDSRENIFFFGPAGGRNTVRVNGKMIINSVELSAYDQLEFGRTKLLFIPLCGEKFHWNK